MWNEKLSVKKYLISLAGWVGLIISSVSWFVYIGVYDHPNPVLGSILLGFSVFLLFPGSKPVTLSLNVVNQVFLIIALLLGVLVIGWPYNIGMLVLLLPLIVSKKQLAQKLFLPGLVLLVQSGIFGISELIFSRFHEFGLAQYPIYMILRAIGADVSFFDNQILLSAADRTITILATYEQMGIPIFLVFSGSALLMGFIGAIEQRKYLHCFIFVGIPLYVFLRVVLLILIYPFANTTQTFWGASELLISFMPLAVIFALFLQMHTSVMFLNLDKHTFITGGLIALSITCFLCSFIIVNPETPKSGRIIIDEYHSQGWASVTEPLDMRNFGGQRSVYTYYTLVKFLRQFYNIDILNDPMQYNNLSKYDILIIKTPNTPFSTEVIENINVFVEKGGGLLLIGDHTNLFNMSEYLNSISKQWGIEFVHDALFDLRTGNLTQYSTRTLFPHPIAAKIQNYKFATPCSLNLSFTARSAITGRGLCSEDLDISHVHFFGDLRSDPKDRWGWFNKSATQRVGKGRVVAFTDSTTFSSFSVLMHDNPEFILSIMNYLNRTDSINLRPIFLFLSVIFLSLAGYFTYSKKIPALSLIVFLLLMPFALSMTHIVHSKRINIHYVYPISEQLNKLPTIAFVTSHTTARTGHFIGIPPRADDFSGFFLGFQRMGFWPREVKKLESLLKKADIKAVVIINPDKAFSTAEKDALEYYVRHGGVLLLVDNALNRNSSATDILRLFGLRSRSRYHLLTIPGGQDVQNGQRSSVVMLPIKTYEPTSMGLVIEHHPVDGFPTLGMLEAQHRNGRVFIMTDSLMLSNITLGDPGMPPTSFQYDLHQELFSIIETVLNRNGGLEYE